jgi:L-aspartate semialdehyde sulfurtransferase ferredoxin
MEKIIQRRLVLKLTQELVNQPLLYNLVITHNLKFSILKASITPQESGLLVVELIGTKINFDQGMKYLKDLNVIVEPLDKDVVRIEEKCTHCGACTAVCPTGALAVEKDTFKVIFDKKKCIACELCITACPPRAMQIQF